MALPLLLAPLLGAAGGGGAGAGLAGILSSVPIIGGLFGKKANAQNNQVSNILSAVGAQNTSAVETFKRIYAKGQSRSYIIYAVLAAVVLGLAYLLSKK